MTETKKYELTGVNGAAVYRSLTPGLKLKMSDASIVEILENAGDGAILLVRIVQDEKNPSNVGNEEYVFYAEVREVIQ